MEHSLSITGRQPRLALVFVEELGLLWDRYRPHILGGGVLLFLYVPLVLLLLFYLDFKLVGFTAAEWVRQILFGPHGMLSGFGIGTWDTRGDFLPIALLAPVVWLPIWVGLLWLTARRERLG